MLFPLILKRLTFDYRDKTCFLVLKALATVLFFEFLVSFNMWSGNELFPQFPVLSFMPVFPLWLGQWVALILMILLAIVIVHPQEKTCHRVLLLFIVPWVFLLLQDWNRLHTFTYLALIIYAGLATDYFCRATPGMSERVNNGFRLLVCCLYIWAGFWKVNPDFYNSIIPFFLSPITSPLLKMTGPNEFLSACIHVVYLLIPFIEMSAGIFLFFPKTRRLGLMVGGAMLCTVLACLGPWGIYSDTWAISGILSWNVFLFSLDLILFKGYRGGPSDILFPASFYQKLVMLFMGVMPIFSLMGGWPLLWSFRMWAGGIYNAQVDFKDNGVMTKLPESIRYAVIEGSHIVDVKSWFSYETNASPAQIPEVYIAAAKKLCAYTTKPDDMELTIRAPFYFWLVDEPKISVSYPCKDTGEGGTKTQKN